MMLEDGSRELSKRPYVQPACCFSTPAGGAGGAGGAGADARQFCCRCAHKRRASPLTCLAICFLVLTYNLLGGFLFLAIEGPTPEDTAVAASMPNLSRAQGSDDLRSHTVERLWSITEDLNILYKENWTKLAAKELMDFQKVLIKTIRGDATHENRLTLEHAHAHAGDYRWTFSSSFLYALTLITTIGQGNVTPQSALGRAVSVAYACVGVPLVMLYLSTLGGALAAACRSLYSRVCSSRTIHSRADCLHRYSTGAGCKQIEDEKGKAQGERQKRTPFQNALNLDTLAGGYHWTCRDHTPVPIALSLFLILAYVALGTLVFHRTERWNLIEGCYFSFSSLATIGFGDLRPGLYARSLSPRAEDAAVGVCCVYILVGVVVVATCFNLIQEDSSAALRRVAALCAGHARAVHVHSRDARAVHAHDARAAGAALVS